MGAKRETTTLQVGTRGGSQEAESGIGGTVKMGNCFFCDKECRDIHDYAETDQVFYRCDYCGKYLLPYSSEVRLKDSRHILAGYLYETNKNDTEKGVTTLLELSCGKIDEILSDGRIPKTVVKKLEKLLVNLYMLNYPIGYTFDFSYEIDKVPAMGYARDYDEYDGMIRAMGELGWLHCHKSCIGIFRITPEGFACAEQLLSTNIDSTKVFVAMAFESDLLDACEKAIKPACKDCGYDAFLVSDREHNQGITDEIIVAIKTSKFVVVDFTLNNCGAYFEAGYAQGCGREVIRLCKKDWFDEENEDGSKKNLLHFDVRHYNLIMWKDYDDLKTKLKNRIRATIPSSRMEDKES
jgi:hypothetical protein